MTPCRGTVLPVRVEPYEDEAWTGYLGRVAAAHHIRLAELSKLLGIHPSGTREPSHRDSGIAATTCSRESLATVLSLSVDAVTQMQLQRFNHRLLNLTDVEIEALDPLIATASSRPARFLRGRGWLRWRPKTHGCRECLRIAPDHWRLSWRVPWLLFCPLHSTLIDELRAEPSAVRSSEALRAAQDRMLQIAYAPEAGPHDGYFDFVSEVGAAVDLLVRHRDSSFHLNALADVRPSRGPKSRCCRPSAARANGQSGGWQKARLLTCGDARDRDSGDASKRDVPRIRRMRAGRLWHVTDRSNEEVRADRRALEALTGRQLDEAWPLNALQPGTRVRVVQDASWGGPWRDVFVGTVDETLPPQPVQNRVAREGEREYSVAFDEPQFDADGGGPYRKAVIWDRYLETLDASTSD